MATRLTQGMTLAKARELSGHDIVQYIDDLNTNWIPHIRGKIAALDRIGGSIGAAVFYSVPKKLTGKQYNLLPGIYCDVVHQGTGNRAPSLVMCDLHLVDRGLHRLLRALRQVEKEINE